MFISRQALADKIELAVMKALAAQQNELADLRAKVSHEAKEASWLRERGDKYGAHADKIQANLNESQKVLGEIAKEAVKKATVETIKNVNKQ